MKKLWDDFEDGDRINGWVKRCERCKSLFVSRKDARFCCDACRVAARRMRERPVVDGANLKVAG